MATITKIELFGTDTLNLTKGVAQSEPRHPGRWMRVTLADGVTVRAWGSWGGYALQAEKDGERIQSDEHSAEAGVVVKRYAKWLAGHNISTDLRRYETLHIG